MSSSESMSNDIKLVPLKELGRWTGGGTPSKAKPTYWENGTIPWVSPKDMKVAQISKTEDYITEAAVCESTTNLVPAGSLLMVTRSGILRHTFPVAIASVPVTINQDLKALIPKPGIISKYVAFALNSFSQDILHGCSKQGTTVNSIDTEKLLRFKIPVVSPVQQERIVAEIEKQFSRLDEAVSLLKRIQANLKRYKAAVLKAAVEGKLTEQWRKDHPEVEPADKLLKRILAERCTKWEAEELAKMQAKGIKPKDDSWKKKYKEPAGPDTAILPELPVGWVWTNFEQIAEASPNALKAGPFGSALKKEYYVPNGYKVYGQEQVISGDPFYGDYYIDQDRFDTLKSCAVKSGDILISLVGTIGKVLILPEGIEPGIINPRLVKFSLNKEYVIPEFVKAYLQSDAVRHSFSARSHGGTMDILNLSMLKELPVPLPPITEQRLMIDQIESSFSIVDELETTIETNLKRAERLQQTILHQAFSGKLLYREVCSEQ